MNTKLPGLSKRRPKREYLVVRHIASDELRVSPIAAGCRPGPDPAYTYGGPFKSLAAAQRALDARSQELRKQLYP